MSVFNKDPEPMEDVEIQDLVDTLRAANTLYRSSNPGLAHQIQLETLKRMTKDLDDRFPKFVR